MPNWIYGETTSTIRHPPFAFDPPPTGPRTFLLVQVLVEDSKALGPTGADRVQFLMEANQGQTRGTVDAVASSGEKSRLLLLLETRLPPPQVRSSAEVAGPGGRRGDGNDVDGGSGGGGDDGGVEMVLIEAGVNRAAPCAVLYDEIDAHVGGRTAVAVGRLLANQGRDSQVCLGQHSAGNVCQDMLVKISFVVILLACVSARHGRS